MPTAARRLANVLLAVIGCLLATPAMAADVTIEKDGDVRRVKTDAYEAEIAADGCLTSLKVGGEEFLAADVDISRGSYWYNGAAMQLPNVEQPEDADGTILDAKSDQVGVRYEFTRDSITFGLSNTSQGPLVFYLVLPPAVRSAQGQRGDFVKLPTTQDWQTTTFYRGAAKLKVDGANRIWGPWSGDTQCVETTVNPGEKRNIVVSAALADDAETKLAAAAAAGKVVQADLVVVSPRDYQVIQRRNDNSADLRVSGRANVDADSVEVMVAGKGADGKGLAANWQPVGNLDPVTRGFNAEIPVPAGGWYKVSVRAKKGDKVVAESTVEHVGVGEVFVVAGQSNSTNSGGEGKLDPESGFVTTFDGSSWRIANDPQPGTHDNSTGGSPWPAFGDAMYEKYKVPIGVAVTGHGGTSTNQWQPGSELFSWTMTRIHQLGPQGFRGLLWHQGESDVGMSTDEYAAKLSAVILGTKKEAGWEFPWFVAQVSYHNPQNPMFNTTRDAQKRLWDEGIALEGPDTDALGGDNRDGGGQGIHFSPKGLKAHGKMWAEKVGVYLDKVLEDDKAAAK